MDIQQLFSALQPFQDLDAKTLTIPAASVTGWTDIHALLTAALADQTLSLGQITSFPTPPTANAIVYQGTASLFPWSGGATQTSLSVTATFSVDAQGEPQLLLRAIVPESALPWTLGASLEGLGATEVADVTFEQALFLLTSQSTRVSDYPDTVAPFVNFQGVLVAAGPFAIAQALLTTPASRTMAGPISLTDGPMPVMDLKPAGAAQVTLAGVALEFGVKLSTLYEVLPYSNPLEPLQTTLKAAFSYAEVVATLAFPPGPPLILSLSVLPEGEFQALTVSQAARPMSSWAELDALAGGIDLGALIPVQFPTATRLVLRNLTLSLYFADPTALPQVDAIIFDVAMEVEDWAILPNDILTVHDIGVAMTVAFEDGQAYPSASFYTHFTIVEEVPMVASLGVPQWVLTSQLQPGVIVSVEALMASVMEKLTGKIYRPPIAMDISRLEMSVGVLDRTFGFGTDILTAWSVAFGEANGGALITLSFDGVSFDIEYDGQLLQGVLTAYTSVNEGRFFFTAASPGDGAGWGFAGGLVEGSSLSVTNLLLGFMYPSGAIPGGAYGVPSLVIDRLKATLSTDANNTPTAYTFDGGMSLAWTFSVFPGSPEFQLSAGVSLHGERATGSLLAPRLGPIAETTSANRGLLVPLGLVDDDTPWTISGAVEGTFSLYDLLISAGYRFSPNNSALTFGVWYKNRGIQATLTQRPNAKTAVQESILTIRLGDLSFGEILEYLINLALPGESRRLSSPWDVLYQINFKNLSLEVNLTTNDIEISYALNLDLTFAQFNAIKLVYKNVNGEGRVYVELTGEFLGQPFGGDDGEPLSWDVINDPAPEVPGKGPSLIDLRYVGMGQHVVLSTPLAELKTVEDIITALKASVRPVSTGGNPLNDPNAVGLRYDGNANWMVGIDATILDTVTLQAVFFDPIIYGGLIALAGPRAGPLAGLRFELLYRKITDDIGELSVDLRVPDMFRHLEFGAVSVTLGVIHLDIYTNGNFRIDLGFPYNQNFSLSFAVEVFPFVGEGGFYFAYLTGATSERVPLVTNGEFSPVIEAGLGLAVGLGKDFQAGPLKAGLKIEVFGIFEGVYAPFTPYDRASGTDTYYWIQGAAGIVGQLYGSVDFVIIKAEVAIVARAMASFVLEAHQPTQIELKLEVTAKAKVKVLFITIHFSFSLTLEESFVLGSASTPAWIEGARSPRLAPRQSLAEAMASPAGAPPRLRQQRSQRATTRLTRLRHARHRLPGLTENPAYRSLHWARTAGLGRALPRLALLATTAGAWPPTPVFGEGNAQVARVQFAPMFTIADPASLHPASQALARGVAGQAPQDDSTGNQVQIVLGLVAESASDPNVHGHAAARRFTLDHVHHLGETGDPPLATMVEAFFRWAAQAGAGKTDDESLSLLALEDVLNELADPAFQQATFDYQNLTDFLNASLHFEVAAYPTSGPAPANTSGVFVPLAPAITATVTQGGVETTRDFSAYNPVSAAYAANLAAYFQQLLTNATSQAGSTPGLDEEAGAPTATPDPVTVTSLAELVFSEYFVLLTQAALQSAIAWLKAYKVDYPETEGPSLVALAERFDPLLAQVGLAQGQRPLDLALASGHHPAQFAAIGGLDDAPLTLAVGVTPLSIAEDNPDAELAADLSLNFPGLAYQVRANQSLDAIAQAVPFVAPATPLTGAAIGTANAGLPGLLRQGANLVIPSFTYQPYPGDTQNFVTAFFQTRNDGVAGAPHLDWYEQAISTLNPTVDWTTLTPQSPAIIVPRAYLDSTAATGPYPIHQGDTLALIAAALARFQAMDNSVNPPVTTATSIPAMAHVIASTDTFDSLVRAFPGLEASALIGANTAASVLTPLAIARLPAFTAKPPAHQTLASMATAYDLSLADLVDIVEEKNALFLGGTTLTIRDVPTQTVNQFVTQLKTTATLNDVAHQVSNFLAHGLRVPAPDDTTFTNLTPQEVLDGEFVGALYGMADQVGQQFAWPDTTTPVTVKLTHASVDWLSFVDTLVVDETTDALVDPQLRAMNPRLARGEAVRPGLILATDAISEIDLTIDAANFGAYLPSTTVTLDAQAPTAATNFDETPVRYNFQVTQHWQAASRPTLPGAAASGAPGEPSLWPLPGNLQRFADAGGKSFTLATTPLSAPPETPATAVDSYAWAIQIPIALSRVANPNDPADTATPQSSSPLGDAWLDGLYLVKGASGADAQRLYDLWTHLAAGDSAELYLLYTPNGAGAAPQGYASDALDITETVLLKTNLSTVTRAPSLAAPEAATSSVAPPSAATYSATIANALDFLCLLWQASVVVEGGFYLRYDAGGAGLPDFVFDDAGKGSLQVVCLLGSQTAAAGGPLLALNNVAVVGANLDASAIQLFAEQTGAGAPVTRVAINPTGTVGFEINRTDPAPPSGDPTPSQMAGMLYGLFGYQIDAATGYTASNEAVPQGPAPETGDLDGVGQNIVYSQAITVYPRATAEGLVAQSNPWLPPAGGDPYAGISSTSAVALRFAAHDVFGNKAVVTDPLGGVSIDNRYTDRLAGIGDWPGTNWSYRPVGVAPNGQLEIDGALQTNTYLPDPQVSSEKALSSASAHAQKFKQAFYQIRRPGVDIRVDSSLSATALTPPLAPLIGYLSAAYVYTSQLAGLSLKTYKVIGSQTLAGMATATSAAAEDLLRDNLERPVDALFSGDVTTPLFAQVKHNETLNAFAVRVGVAADTLLSQWGNAAVARIPAGVDLVIAPAQAPLVPDATLAGYAASVACTAGDIARANQDVAGLIGEGLTLGVRGIILSTGENDTFASLVGRFAGLGITTNVEEIGVANQNVPGLLVLGQDHATFAYDRRLVATTTTVASVVASLFGDDLAQFIALNGELAGLLAQDNRLRIGQTVAPAPVDSLRRYLAHASGVSLADFAAANAAAALKDATVWLVPAQLDTANLAATPYGVQAGKTFGQIATLFGVSAEVLGEEDETIPGIFVPDQTVTVGSASVVTGPEDSLATLIGKFPAGAQPSLAQLVAAIADQSGLMAPGAALVCPVPIASAAGPGAVLTLNTLAGAFMTDQDGVKLAKSNAALLGFLKAGATFTLAGQSFTVGQDQTLANLLGAVNAVLDAPLAYDAMLAALLDQAIVSPSSKVLLPPPPATLRARLPATPAMSDVISRMETTLTLSRPPGEIDAAFANVATVREATTPIAPLSDGVPATLTTFATALADLYGGALQVAASGRGGQGEQRQYVVRFDAPADTATTKAIREVAVETGASFLGLPPLANSLVSRPADVRTYVSGGAEPFTTTTNLLRFQAVDVGDWVSDFLATLEQALSPAYASAGYAATAAAGGGSTDFDGLLAAKASLADKIAGQLTAIESGDAAIDPLAARKAMSGLLSVNLSTGYATDAVIQVPTRIQAQFGGGDLDRGGHRLTGKTSSAHAVLSTASTLQAVADGYSISVDGVFDLLSATPNILQAGVVLTLDGKTWTIGEHDTLQNGCETLSTTPQALAAAFKDQAPLFRDGVQLTIDGYAASSGFGDSLATMADALDVSLRFLALANQDLAGLLTGTVYVGATPVSITPATSSLAGLAQAQGLAVGVLAAMIGNQAVLTDGSVLRVVRWTPEYSLNPGKIGLDAASGALTLLLNVKNKARYRRLFLNLAFEIGALEYQVERADYVEGYETSSWLTFVNPLPATPARLGGALVDTHIGQLDIPIPLRAYPATPRLDYQSARATYRPSDIPPTDTVAEKIAKAEAWSYSAAFEMALAAQDTAQIGIGLNYRPKVERDALAVAADPFEALAEWATNASAIKADLALLIEPATASAPAAISAVAALADVAGKIAANWGFVQAGSSDLDADAGDGLIPSEYYGFDLQTRTRPGPAGVPLLDALVLIRAAGTETWGPDGQIPSLGYLDVDGTLRPLDKPAPPIGPAPASLSYDFKEDVPEDGRRTYVIWYDALNVVTYQNARAAVSVSRNRNLSPGKATNSLFVYQTPQITFANLATPSLRFDHSLLFGSGPASALPAALTTLFSDLLGPTPDTALSEQRMTGDYGFVLASAGQGGVLSPDDLVSMTPMFFRPTAAYDPATPTNTSAAVADWLSVHAPAPTNTAFCSFGVQIFSGMIPTLKQPLMDFTRLDFQLTT
ncbi:hypothetical protein [Caulobacter sp.]|uniref:hypothetical protein n=1 Tax=Caulobacter sp. TaxID=78 RepID=UPI002B49B3A3|nr:hypothetical protein [Caulobacter sp.]HJV41710.1 hypothetical protein [Caulobacter sp.]